ncbi:MAG: hypothetical protein F2696_04655 [Actinobacteria bacterium]|uniref:Unannotated protein n=1 Tax=freshwater metagenome TaxID=449393 RepID=A0A6J6SZQ5_9ZZZZ|nr:hypothetical protein [Actinomycetota bacterium]
MKSQIALIGIGLAIAAGVAFVELKPASNTQIAPVVATPASKAPTKVAAEVKSPAPKSKPVPTISKPKITGGDEGDEERGEHNDRDEGDDD